MPTFILGHTHTYMLLGVTSRSAIPPRYTVIGVILSSMMTKNWRIIKEKHLHAMSNLLNESKALPASRRSSCNLVIEAGLRRKGGRPYTRYAFPMMKSFQAHVRNLISNVYLATNVLLKTTSTTPENLLNLGETSWQ
jgi:hypothetical protein